MNDYFERDEKLYRFVKPISDCIRTDGTITSAVFKQSNGCSVDRGNYRSDDDVANTMRNRDQEKKDYKIVNVSVTDCISVDAVVKYLPEDNNEYHSEIHSSFDKVMLTSSQARNLARMAKFV